MRSNRLLLALIAIAALLGYTGVDSSGHLLSVENSKGEIRRWEVTGPWGGDVRSLVASPDNDDLLYLGTSDGQLFRSTDGAQTWNRISPGLGRPGLSVDSIVIDPRRAQTIYVGAWAVAHNEEGGVFKSEDGGQSWRLLEGTKGLSVRTLAMSASDSGFLVAGTANEDKKLNGAYRSTDSGKSWERISPEGDREIRNVESVAIDPIDTNIIYIGTFHLPWKTTDGGKTWRQTGYKATGMIDDSDIFGISVNPSDHNLVYMNACSGIYRSNSGGEKWLKLPGIPFSARRTYTLLTHPSAPNILFAGTSEGLWRSRDSGKKWMLLTSKNAVVRSIVMSAAKPDRVLIATDGFGVQISRNMGDDFALSNTGFIHRHILAIMPDATEHGRVLASAFHDGSSGSVFVSTDDGNTWQLSSRGLGTREVYSFHQASDNPELVYAGTNTGVYRSTDRGASWAYAGVPEIKQEKPVKKPSRPAAHPRHRAAGPTKPGKSASFKTVSASRRSGRKTVKSRKKPAVAAKPPEPAGPRLVQLTKEVDDIVGFTDPQGRRVLLAATIDGLYRSIDETKGWEKVVIEDYDPMGRVFAVSVHKDALSTIFVGTRQGLFISHDGGTSWDHCDRGPSDMSVKAIAQDPRNPNLVIIGTNQFVYRSTNGGRTWVMRGGGLTVGDYTSVSFNPANPDEVMVADYSRGGVYRSSDKGYIWERIDAGLPSSRVWTLSFDPFEKDRLFAGSFSSGIYVMTIQHAGSAGHN